MRIEVGPEESRNSQQTRVVTYSYKANCLEAFGLFSKSLQNRNENEYMGGYKNVYTYSGERGVVRCGYALTTDSYVILRQLVK